MTAIIAIRDRDRAHLVTDGAATDADGRLLGRDVKVAQFPHINAALAISGTRLAMPVMEISLASLAHSYGEFKKLAVENAQQAIQVNADVMARAFGTFAFNMVAAGIDDDGRPDTFLVCNHELLGREPWSIVDLGELAMLPGDAETTTKLHSRPLERDAAGALDVAAFARRAMEVQRRKRCCDPYTGKLVHRIGAFLQVTTVAREMITTRMVHEWHGDAIGKLIEAEA